MADLLTLNAVKKVEKKLEGQTFQMPRPEHGENITCITGGNNCCILVPETASKMVVEMWGQGGAGAGSFCCRNGIKGGQGGDYGTATIDLTNKGAQSLCGCACTCTCAFNCCCGTNGQCSRLTNCTTGEQTCWVTKGGHGGCSCCFWNAGSYCGTCNEQYNTDIANSSFWGNSSTNLGTNSIEGFGTCTNINVDSFNNTSSADILNTSDPLNTIFAKVECAGFDEYRRGACGWSGKSSDVTNTCANSCWNAMNGVGGASYAGGNQQTCNTIPTNYNHQGVCGNFPGGGGSSAGTTSSTICCGGFGGAGLILVSWE